MPEISRDPIKPRDGMAYLSPQQVLLMRCQLRRLWERRMERRQTAYFLLDAGACVDAGSP